MEGLEDKCEWIELAMKMINSRTVFPNDIYSHKYGFIVKAPASVSAFGEPINNNSDICLRKID